MAPKSFSYNGYTGSIEVSVEDECLHGRIQFIDDMITYEGSSLPELKRSFEEAVDRYIEHCKETGNPPNKPYSGTFNIRTSPEIHRAVALAAFEAGFSLNEWVGTALKQALNCTIQKVEHHHQHTVRVQVDNSNRSWIASTNSSVVETCYAH